MKSNYISREFRKVVLATNKLDKGRSADCGSFFSKSINFELRLRDDHAEKELRIILAGF